MEVRISKQGVWSSDDFNEFGGKNPKVWDRVNENLLANTNKGTLKWSNSAANGSYSKEEVSFLGVNAVKMNCTTPTTSWKMFTFGGARSDFFDRLEAGETYYISYDTDKKYNISVTLRNLMESNASNGLNASTTLVSKTETDYGYHYIYKIVLKSPITWTAQLVYFGHNLQANTYVIIANLKIEKGSISTPWIPNVLDYDGDASVSANSTVTADSIYEI